MLSLSDNKTSEIRFWPDKKLTTQACVNPCLDCIDHMVQKVSLSYVLYNFPIK